jgi:cell division protein ZapA
VKVEIYGQTYNVQGEQDEAYVRQLAALVDEKMRSVAESTSTVDSLRVAVLTALNMADELQRLRASQEAVAEPVRTRVEHCVALVEKALEQSS